MKKLFLILTLFISFKLIAQNPSNYQYRTVRERLIASMLDSSHHVPRYNGIPSGLRVGMSANAGAIAADTLNHGFFLYSGQLWRKVGTEGVKCGLTCNSCGLVTWTGTGLVFEVTAADYNLNGASYHYSGGNVTLDAADGSFDRFDAIVLTSSGLSKVTGTASADPQLPQFDPCASVLLTYVFVQTGATTPVQVSDELIYDENVETWTHTTSGTISANFASTVTSSVGTKSIAIASWSNNANIIFTAPSTLTTSNYTTFSFYLKLGTTMTSNQNISVQFFNGTTAISNIVPAPFTKSYTSSFQGAVMSMSQFTFTNSTFTAIKLIFSGSNANTVYIDFARLQSGITQPPSGQTYTARLPIRITGTVISADTSTAFVPSLTTNGRLLKVADSIRVAAIAGSSASLTSGYVGYGSGSNLLTGEAAFNYNAVDDILNTYVLQANNLLLFDFNSIGTPPSGWTGIYSDSHGRVYSKNDAGTIVELTNTAGGTPNLQEVTDAGNTTTNTIIVDNANFDAIGGTSFRVKDDNGNVAAILWYHDNNYGELRFKAGTGTINIYPYLTTNTNTNLFLPSTGNGNDTLATLHDVRAGGGSSSVTVNTEPWYAIKDELRQNNRVNFDWASGGAGSSATAMTHGGANVIDDWMYGAVLNTGTTTTGVSFMYSAIAAGGDYAPIAINSSFRYNVGFKVRLEDLSVVGDRFEVWCGFSDANNAVTSITDGVYFRYIDTDSSGTWICVTESNGTKTEDAVGSAVAADTDYELEISVFNGEAKFYINKVLVSTITTNIPTGTARQTSVALGILKSLGTTPRILYVDWGAYGTMKN